MKNKKDMELIENIDEDLILAIQPAGGMSFKDGKTIDFSSGYMACLHIYDYPHSPLGDTWLKPLVNIKNTFVTIDIATEDTHIIQENIKKSVKTQKRRIAGEKDETEKAVALRKGQDLINKYLETNLNRSVGKLIIIRIFVVAKTREELDSLIFDIKKERLKDFPAEVFLTENINEYKSLFLPYNAQKNLSNFRDGQLVYSDQLAMSYPFSYSALLDPKGFYYGKTPLGGPVLFDLFHHDDVRKSYSFAVMGLKGAGKSTFLKKSTEDRRIRNDFVKIIDPMGEFAKLAEYYGGKVITFNADRITVDENGNKKKIEGSVLNPLEILETDIDDNTNWLSHVSKMEVFYQFLSPMAQTDELSLFLILLKDFYIDLGVVPHDMNFIEQSITNLPPKNYPIFGEFLDYLNDKLYIKDKKGNKKINEKLSDNEVNNLQRIIATIRSLVELYGGIFNAHSSYQDISNEKLVVFDVSNLRRLNKEFHAQLYNILMFALDSSVKVGSVEKEKFENAEITEDEIVHNMILIDEAHFMVNSKNSFAVDALAQRDREGRKYFISIGLASQQFSDFFKETAITENQEKMKELFRDMQYSFIMQQDPSSVDLIADTFKNHISVSEANRISKFKKGECLLVQKGTTNIEFSVALTKEKEKLYAGGI